MTRYLAIQHNAEGRPCGWGLATSTEAAKAEAKRQYDSHGFEGHGCYPGEEKGEMSVTPLVEDEEEARS